MDGPTWSRIKQQLSRRHRFAGEAAAEVRFVLAFDAIPVGVRVRPASAGAVVVLAEIADAGALEPVEALRLNATLFTRSLPLIGTTYVIRAIVDELGDDELERRLQGLAAVAASIKRSVRRTIDPKLFMSYMD